MPIDPKKPNQGERHILQQNRITFEELSKAWGSGTSGRQYIGRILDKPLSPEMRGKFIDAVGLVIARRRKEEAKNAKTTKENRRRRRKARRERRRQSADRGADSAA